MNDSTQADPSVALECATRIVVAYLSRPGNAITTSEIPDLLRTVRAGLTDIVEQGAPAVDGVQAQAAAVPIAKSVTRDYIVCLEDGKHCKLLKPYLRSHFRMTPDEYRAKWGLPPGYPMVAPSYSAHRQLLAKSLGLGQRITRPRRAA